MGEHNVPPFLKRGRMNRFLLYCSTFMCCLNGFAQDDFIAMKIKILPSSQLSITGDTNISQFECVFNTLYLEDFREVAYRRNGDAINFKNAILFLKNEGFDCGNKVINKDFHALLNTKKYPKITLELTEIKINKGKRGEAYVKIAIAGKEKKYRFPVDIISAPLDRFIGKLKLDIRDFNLEAPKKMFGLIVIKDEIEIDFELVARL